MQGTFLGEQLPQTAQSIFHFENIRHELKNSFGNFNMKGRPKYDRLCNLVKLTLSCEQFCFEFLIRDGAES